MQLSLKLPSGKRKYLFAGIFISFIAVLCAALSVTGNDSFDFARREILLRKIGHELLLQSGDSTSRVLPVKRTGENNYQIRFEHALSFQTDALVNISRRWLDKDPLAGDYVVNVLNRGNSSVAYGYAISKNKKDDIVACIGRRQPKAYYMINITFKPAGIRTTRHVYLLSSLPFLAFFGFIFLSAVKPLRVLTHREHDEMITLGTMLFDARNRKLLIHGNTIDLTGTENRLLRIFALSPNETIERSRLQKKIWEDEGIIVGRSLDMFISKLRKKLESDPDLKIVVIRGKGYRLEVDSRYC